MTGSVCLRLLAVLALAVFFAFVPPWRRPGFPEPAITGPGVAVGYDRGEQNLDALGPVWYTDYQFESPAWPNHQRLYLIWISSLPSRVALVAKEHPGQWWTLGNEPNDPNQDNIAPEAYVRTYHDMYYALKSADPQARIVPTGVANADWEWLDRWREEYRKAFGTYPPVDGWRFHNYLLETCAGALDVDRFKERITDFRAWTKRIGDDTRPLLLTEYGVLYGNGCCGCPTIPREAVVAYMRATTNWLQSERILSAWAWFSVDSENRYNGDLFSAGDILETGRAYRDLVSDWEKQTQTHKR